MLKLMVLLKATVGLGEPEMVSSPNLLLSVDSLIVFSPSISENPF